MDKKKTITRQNFDFVRIENNCRQQMLLKILVFYRVEKIVEKGVTDGYQ